MSHRIIFALLATLLLAPAAARAQSRTEGHRFEAGFVFTVLDLRGSIREKPGALGGRFTYNFGEYAAFDSELVYYPQGGGGDFGETQGLFGVRAGKRFGRVPVGIFVKARPGFLRLGPAVLARNPALGETKFALDLGGVLELYPSRRTIVRIDYGDTVVAFGDTPVNSATAPPRSFGTTHNKQASLGFGYRF